MNKETLEIFLNKIAFNRSLVRRIAKLDEDPSLLPSSQHEMNNDWYESCVGIVFELLHSPSIAIESFEIDTYPVLETVWLKDIKSMGAYLQWKGTGTTDTASNYYHATDIIRGIFHNHPRHTTSHFGNIKKYIEDKYLVNGKFSSRKSKEATNLVRQKAERIWEMTQYPKPTVNWHRAEYYTKLYYENIIPAIERNDPFSMANVLKAFDYSKTETNHFIIMNAFETLLPICFFDKEKMLQILTQSQSWACNVVPLDHGHGISEKLLNGELKYYLEAELLILDGIISQDEVETVKKSVPREKREMVDELRGQSNRSSIIPTYM